MQEEGSRKRKALLDNIEQSEWRKCELSKDMEELYHSADRLAEKAEEARSIDLVVKSNSLHKAAGEKKLLLEKINKEIDRQVETLKAL